MSKDKKDREDFDVNEWGNIGPDSILDPNWKRKRSTNQIESQRKKLTDRYQDDAYKEEWKKANIERWEDAEWKEQHLAKMKAGRTEESEQARIEAVRNSKKHKESIAKMWADPEFRKRIAEANSKPMTEEQKEHLRQMHIGKPKSAEILAKRAATVKAKQMSNQKVNSLCRSIQTPKGIFHNQNLIVQEFDITKGTIRRRCLSKDEKFKDWYYID